MTDRDWEKLRNEVDIFNKERDTIESLIDSINSIRSGIVKLESEVPDEVFKTIDALTSDVRALAYKILGTVPEFDWDEVYDG